MLVIGDNVALAQPVTTLSPLNQFKVGVSLGTITCKEGFQLILKIEDESPACVSSLTFAKLILRGWGYDPIHELSFDGLKDTYELGQAMDFGIKYKGYAPEYFCSFPVVVAKYENKTVWQSNLFILSCPISETAHFHYSQMDWQVGSNSNLGIMNLNNTGVYSIVVTWFKSPDIELQKNITIVP